MHCQCEGSHCWKGTCLEKRSVPTELTPTEGQVQQLFSATFNGASSTSTKCVQDPDGSVHCLCAVGNSSIDLYLESGVIHHVPLPFLARRVIPIPNGLLIERKTSVEKGANDGLPVLFSLLHPIGDLCPVVVSQLLTEPSSVPTASSFFTNPQLHVVGSCRCGSSTSLLLLHHADSHKHSIWEILPAKTADIPALYTPHRGHNDAITPQHPLSTSAPSHFPQRTPHTMETPVNMVLASWKIAVPTLCSQLHKATPYPPSGEGRRGIKIGSGRSPFYTQLQSPHISKKMRSKSLSPPMLSRISPYSQVVNSNSWSTFYEESAAGSLHVDTLLPQLLLRHKWEEEESVRCPTSRVFCCSDLLQQSYFCYLTPASSQLWVLPCSCVTGTDTVTFGKALPLPALQAQPLPTLHLTLVLEPEGVMCLYSGTLKICSIQEYFMNIGVHTEQEAEMMEEGRREIVSIGEVMNTTITAVFKSGTTIQYDLPHLYFGFVDEVCLKAVSEVVPKDTAHHMLAHYYRTVLQSNPTHLDHQSYIGTHFKQWLFGMVQLENGGRQNVVSGKSTTLLTSVPALQLFDSGAHKRGHSSTDTTLSFSPILAGHTHDTFHALHIAYEELKLFTTAVSSLSQLACLLYQLAVSLGGHASYLDHYWTDFPSLLPRPAWDGHVTTEEQMDEEGGCSVQYAPCIMSWLRRSLNGAQVQPFPSLHSCSRLTKIVKLYSLYVTPAGVHIPLSSLLTSSVVTESAVSQWEQVLGDASSPYERVVLGMVAEGMTREDLSSLPVGVALPLWDALLRCREAAPSTWSVAAYDIIGRDDIVKTMQRADDCTLVMESADKDNGMTMDEKILKLHFPKDLRVNEVKRMLDSSQPVKITIEQKPEVSDHEFIEQQESTLLAICQRTMSLPVGRGMFTLGTSRPLPTSPLSLPHLNLTGKAPPRNSTVGLEHIDKPANMSVWAEFHNGVAAGLRISPTVSKLDSMWILSNRPSPPSPSSTSPPEEAPQRHSAHHAGVLLALGLTGHLTALMEYELFEYLNDKHELTTIAVLLGITAARVGTMQRSIASILSIFIPSLLPFGAADMEVSPTIQTAALVGMGLLYMGSGNRHLSEIMLREISHVSGPEMEFSENRETYSLAAGVALGMITLGRGGDLPGMGDLRLVDQLSLLISGGMKTEVVSGPAPQTPSHLVLEPPAINIHVTSPAATVALGLMYLKTNDSSVASRLDTPTTLYELDFIRSDFFILRSMSRGLIMWDEVKPTQEWINSNIPQIIKRKAFQDSRGEDEKLTFVDHQTLSQAFVCITAGCCMAIGLRYAGTADQQAHTVLMKNIRFLLSKIASSSTAEEAGKQCLDMCLSVVLLSVAMVMSGTGDLEVLRVVRRLHARATNPEVTYGSHMAAHMALGLLFLGGCRYSLSRSNRAVASLYVSLFPLFPSSSTDSRYHLQALRHLYVLAAEPRVLVARDVETGQVTSVKVCVRGEGELRASTPCIVPEWMTIREIEICSPDFWPMKLNLNGEDNKMRQVLAKSGTVFVRPKTGGYKVQLAQGALPLSLSPHIYSTCNVIGKLELSEDNFLRKCSFGQLLSPDITQDSMWQRFLTAALLECVSEEKLPVFPSLLHLDKLSRGVLSSSSSTTDIWQLKLAWALTDRVKNDLFQLLHKNLADVLLLRVKQTLYQFSNSIGDQRTGELLRTHFVEGGEREGVAMGEEEAEWLVATVVVYSIPPRHALAMTPDTTVPQLLTKLQSLQAPASALVRLLPLMKSKLPQPLDLPFLNT